MLFTFLLTNVVVSFYFRLFASMCVCDHIVQSISLYRKTVSSVNALNWYIGEGYQSYVN